MYRRYRTHLDTVPYLLTGVHNKFGKNELLSLSLRGACGTIACIPLLSLSLCFVHVFGTVKRIDLLRLSSLFVIAFLLRVARESYLEKGLLPSVVSSFWKGVYAFLILHFLKLQVNSNMHFPTRAHRPKRYNPWRLIPNANFFENSHKNPPQ